MMAILQKSGIFSSDLFKSVCRSHHYQPVRGALKLKSSSKSFCLCMSRVTCSTFLMEQISSFQEFKKLFVVV